MARSTRTLIAGLAASAALALVGTALTAADAAPAASPRPVNPNATTFALKGWGYGTSVQGGQVPAGIGATAYQGIGCTNRVGVDRTNELTDVTLPGVGTVSGIKTRVWTAREGDAVSIYSQNTIGKVTLSDSPLGTLLLDAVTTTARAYHDATGFHATTTTDLAALTFQPPVGPPVALALPAPGNPIEIPGVARITLAHGWKPTTGNGARAFANGLKIKLIPTDTTVRVAHAVAQIGTDMRKGIFHGGAHALSGSVAGDLLTIGNNVALKMPCQGTDGAVRTRQLAGLDLAGLLTLGGVTSDEMANQTTEQAAGWTRSRVGSISLGGGALRIDGVVAQANVSRTGPRPKDLARNADGTSIGTITVNGQPQELPLDQPLELPGLAKLEPKVVTALPNGIAVTALRITLLDGTGAVLDLGNARLQLRRLPGDR